MPPPPCSACTADVHQAELSSSTRLPEQVRRGEAATRARVFPSRLGSEPLWMWECGCRRQRAFLDTRGDVRTEAGALSGWLSSKLTGCFGDVAGSPGRLGVARNRAAGFFSSIFQGIFYLVGGDGMREKPRRIPQHYGATHCRQREY